MDAITISNGAPSNGRPAPPLPTDLKSVRAQRRLVEAQIQLRRLEQSRNLLESLGDFWGDTWGGRDLFDRVRRQDDDGREWIPISLKSDRRQGDNWPIFRNEVELARFRSGSRVLCASNNYAKGLLKNLTNYVLRKGFAWKAASKELSKDADQDKPGVQQPQEIKALVSQVQDVIDATVKASWGMARQREAFRRTRRDGEVFLRLFRDEDGTVYLRSIEPERITDPPGVQRADGWSYGIKHLVHDDGTEDVETVVAYWVSNVEDNDGEEVPAEDIIHVKLPDQDSTVKRGMPEFSLDTLAAFDRAAKLQRNISIAAAIRAATAETWKFDGATKAQVQALVGDLRERQTTDHRTGKPIDHERIEPGTIRRIPAGQEPVTPAPDQSASLVSAVGGDLREASCAFTAPEYMTGDASNGNYSSLETASAPFVVNGETEQEYYKEQFTRPVQAAIDWAIKCGKLPATAKDLVDIQCEAPSVVHRNDLERSQEDDILMRNKVKSPQTVAMEKGLDPQIEMANWEEFDERMGGQGLSLIHI